ncbi:MAG TPA: hypothetical protein PLC15_01900 [Candidatus Obscuribacter sp.]|nr:glucosaminidase domain-containing protein [Candidatus Obscuribacter sp.]HMW89215.1 hypothetical protein [Candidatus Obscuribacter sp.]HMX47508.1 hypothetical protein [Candidatus Obscuribacter sp.]HMY55133.1 hypothetical protein [Candidatus Obscuribacter sp.]HNA73709.1 hypothetical protein [Candidatus Obscuribacter sp.]
MVSHSNFEISHAPAEASADASSAFHSDYYASTIGARSGQSDAVKFSSAIPAEAPPPAGLSAAAWSQMSQWVGENKQVNISTPGDGQVPDYIIGANGDMVANPAKTTPNPDGSITVQMDGSKGDAASLQAAKELKIAVIQEKIFYWQKAHPNETNIPGYLEGMLAAAQSAPVTPAGGDSQRPQPVQQARPEVQPQPQPMQTAAPSRNYGLGGGEKVGNSSIGTAPTSGYRSGSFEPNGPIDRTAIPRPVEGDLNIKGPPSANADQIQTFLEKMGSPAAKEAGFSQALYTACTERGIDPAVAVGFFLQESTCGRYGRAHDNHSLGNIKGRAPESGGTDGTFRRYDTWAEGARDWARLIDESYVQKRGLSTLSQVIGVYAPSSDGNNENRYVATVKGVVENFKQQNATA